jgi:hypothetical protein
VRNKFSFLEITDEMSVQDYEPPKHITSDLTINKNSMNSSGWILVQSPSRMPISVYNCSAPT